MNKKIKKYLILKKKIDLLCDESEDQDILEQELENLYFDLSDEEMDYIECYLKKKEMEY